MGSRIEVNAFDNDRHHFNLRSGLMELPHRPEGCLSRLDSDASPIGTGAPPLTGDAHEELFPGRFMVTDNSAGGDVEAIDLCVAGNSHAAAHGYALALKLRDWMGDLDIGSE